MASSQVEVASSSPFGCVLRDHNSRDRRRERCRDQNERTPQANLQKNLKDLVRDHLHGCISASGPSSDHDENAENRDGAGNHQRRRISARNSHESSLSTQQARVLDRWAARQAREIVSTIEHEAELLSSSLTNPSAVEHLAGAPSPSGMENCPAMPEGGNASARASKIGASSLVRIWEARLNHRPSNATNHSPPSTASEAGDSPPTAARSEPRPSNDHVSLMDLEALSQHAAAAQIDHHHRPSTSSSPVQAQNMDEGERERVRVADIIRRLVDHEHDHDHDSPYSTQSSPARDYHQQQNHHYYQQENRNRRIIRGRQAFTDMLMQMERTRKAELSTLGERHAVSRFPQRGRIQSMLRLRAMQRGMIGWDKLRSLTVGNRISQGSTSTITHLRERFNSGVEHRTPPSHDIVNPRSTGREIVKDTQNRSNSSSSSQQKEERRLQEANASKQPSTSSVQHSVSQRTEDICENASLSSDVMRQGKNPLPSIPNLQGTVASSVQYTVSQRTEDLREEATVRSRSVCTWQETNSEPSLPSLQETGASSVQHSVLQRTSDLCEEATVRSVCAWQGTNSEPSLPSLQETDTSSVQHSVIQRTEDLCEEATVRSVCARQGMDSEPNLPSLQETGTSSVQHSVIQRTEDLCEEASLSSDVACQGTNLEASSIPSIQETLDTTASINDWYESEITEEQEEIYDEQTTAANYNWISDISRPRSYWEDRRRAWYEEMLNTRSNNEEIRQLLERRRVSSCLDSDFRDKMDRLMMSHVQIQTNDEERDDSPQRFEQLMLTYMQRHEQQEQQQQDHQQQAEEEEEEGEEEEEEEEEDEDEDEDEEEVSGYFDQSAPSLQMPSPSLLRDWGYNDNYSDQIAYTESHLPSQSPPFYQRSHQLSPFRNSSSTEMELIYDLRSHMEQMHREMSELRSTIKGCVDMQLKLQNSIRQEVYSALEEEKRSYDRAPKKGSCCICYEKRVDSLLYRCGHMCTCLKCAHELQWSSGKCPICRAPIVDIVRAYADS